MPETLIVGGLTIDRFADGTSAPGGSVLHSGVAAVAAGSDPALLTIAGDEPEARDGLAQLGLLGAIHHQVSRSTITYRHADHRGRRTLTLEAAAGPIAPDAPLPGTAPRVALLAPIADELPAPTIEALRRRLGGSVLVFLIQGWLRRLEVGSAVEPIPLSAVGHELWTSFAAADAVVLSTEDLAEHPDAPFAQARALRDRLGPRPVVVLTLGTQGYLLDDPAADEVVAAIPRRVVEGVNTVGAGDTFGVVFAIHLARGAEASEAARAATEAVIELFERRRG